jgi:hypothetical protein
MTWHPVHRVGWMLEVGFDHRQSLPSLLQPLVECPPAGRDEELGLDRWASLFVRYDGRGNRAFQAGDVPAPVHEQRSNDCARRKPGAEDRVFQGTDELSTADVDLHARSLALPEPSHRLVRGRLVGDHDVANSARLKLPVEVLIAVVIRANVGLGDHDVRGHKLDQPGDGRRRHSLPIRRRSWLDPVNLDLVGEDGFGDELLDDPPSQVRRARTVVRRHVPAARTSTEVGDALLEAGQPNLASRDRGDDRIGDDRIGDDRLGDRHAVGQPLTPPTVIPSMKKRCATRKMMTTGRTISVEAAISRL